MAGLSGIEHSRIASVAGLVACAMAAACALWMLVRLAWALVPSDDAALATPAGRVDPAPVALAPSRSIAQSHLFGEAPARAQASGSTTALILRGTLAERDPKAGLAVISDAGVGERTWRVGDEVTAGVKLAGVYADHIVVTRDGVEESLRLPRDTDGAPAAQANPATASAAASGASTTPGTSAGASTRPPRAPPEWRDTVARLRQNPAELAKQVQIVPVLDGGKLKGVRVSTGTNAGLLAQIGLQPGDLVTQVNGVPIDSAERGQQIMSSLGTARSVRVTVVRDGKPTDITVGLQ